MHVEYSAGVKAHPNCNVEFNFQICKVRLEMGGKGLLDMQIFKAHSELIIWIFFASR